MSSRHDPLLPPLPEHSKTVDPTLPVRQLARPLTHPLVDFDQVETRGDDPTTTAVTPHAPNASHAINASHAPGPTDSLPPRVRPSSPLTPAPTFLPLAPTLLAAPRARRLQSREVAILVTGLGVCLAILLAATLLVARPFASLVPLVPGTSAVQPGSAATSTATSLPTVTPLAQVTPSPSLTATATASSAASPTASPAATPGAAPTTAAATFLAFDPATQGNWQGTYGSAGYVLAGDTQQQLPTAIQVTLSGAALTTWAVSTADIRALVKPENPADRIAACWYASTTFTIDVTITGGQSYQLALYLLDWDQQQRVETVSVIDPTSGAALDTRSASAFGTGAYLVWKVSGHVTIQVTNAAGSPNAVVSALFLAPA